MEAKELRIGNLIRYNDTKEVYKVYQLEHRYKNVYRINGLNENPAIEPIPLTEEWFLKFGWKYNNITNRYEPGEWRFHIEILLGCDGFLLCTGHTIIARTIKYVHQLQNLYFALTGEELVLSEV